MGPSTLRSRVIERLAADSRLLARAATSLERLGAHTAADRVDRRRSRGDLVPVRVPPSARSWRTRRFKMYELDGRDQVARKVRAGGFGGFEPPLPAIFIRLVRRWPGTVLDVGANTGFYALAAVTAHPENSAIAFEPVPAIADLLRSNIAANALENRIEIVESAVGDQDGDVRIHLPPAQVDGTIETSASLLATFKSEVAEIIDTRCTTLDSAWLRSERPPVHVVKIDVEGAEHLALDGAHELITRARPVLTVEVLDTTSAEELERRRQDIGYVDVRLSEVEAVVGQPVRAEVVAPNHLLVPGERLGDVIDDLRSLHRLVVTVVDS